jgi:hypothetical protein
MKDIPDPVERVRVQALFKTCQGLVKESKDALVNKKSKGTRAMLERFVYVQPGSHAD